jgi:hypothetical protein
MRKREPLTPAELTRLAAELPPPGLRWEPPPLSPPDGYDVPAPPPIAVLRIAATGLTGREAS